MLITEKEYFDRLGVNFESMVSDTEQEEFNYTVNEAHIYGNGILLYGRCTSGSLESNDKDLCTSDSLQHSIRVLQVFPKHVHSENVIRKKLYKGETAVLFVESPVSNCKLFADCLNGKTLKCQSLPNRSDGQWVM